MDFSLYFQKLIWPGKGFIFGQKKALKKPNTLVNAQFLVVTCRKLNSDKCLLRPPPPLLLGIS